MTFIFQKLDIKDVILVKPKIIKDSRGFFLEGYKQSEFSDNGINLNLVQSNYSKSTKGVLRGLHYQANPKAQAKLVSCLSGEIFDVAVDIRKGSPTYGNWLGEVLTSENKEMIYIPRGFAHGFVVLSEEAEVFYMVDNEYLPQSDRGIKWNDPTINVQWGVDFEPIISEKDVELPLLADAQINFQYEGEKCVY